MRLLQVLVLGFGLSFFAACASAQPGIAPVEKIDGEKYYMHTVKEGNTLWGLSKMYAIGVNSIREANPEMTDVLQLSQTIRIPLSEMDRKEAKTAPVMEGNALTHTVKSGETVYGLCKKYQISQEALQAANPDMVTALTIGQKLTIPTNEVKSENTAILQPAGGNNNASGTTVVAPDTATTVVNTAVENYKKHTVKPRETLYGIAASYKVPAAEIKKLNAAVFEAGLRPGDVLMIPNPLESTAVTIPNGDTTTAPPVQHLGVEGQYKVAVFLPFYVEKNKAILRSTNPNEPKGTYPKSIPAFDTYAGIQMAIDSLKQQGLSVEVNVYDTGNDTATVRKALNSSEMVNTHLIIGPLYNQNLDIILPYAKKNGIKVVAPISRSNDRLIGNPSLNRTTPSYITHVEHMAKYVQLKYSSDNILLIKSPVKRDTFLTHLFENQYNSYVSTNGDSLKVAKTGSHSMKNMMHLFSADKVNVLVLPSTNEAYVSHFFTMLSALPRVYDKYQFMVLGLENWENYEGIDYSLRERFNMQLTSSVSIDFEEERTVNFIRDFRLKNKGADASEYTLRGFDVAYFYLSALNQYGTGFQPHLSEVKTDPLSTHFQMRQAGLGNGYENESVFIYRYSDYQLIRVD